MPGPWEKYQQPTQDATPWAKYGEQPQERVPTPQQPAIMQAAPTGVGAWLGDVEQDVLKGGGRTAVGRVLGTMQGRGDKGYSGLEAGVSPETARYMGSPVLGPIHAAQGIAMTPEHPIAGPIKAIGGALETATIPASFIAPEAAGTGADIPSVLGLPSRYHAGQIFGDIGKAAEESGTMISGQQTMPALQEWRAQMAAGGKPAGQKAIQNLSTRMLGTPARPIDAAPMPWGEARLRYSHIAEQAREPILQRLEGRGMTPKVKATAGGVQSGLRSDLSQAAESIGMGPQFEGAMNEYRRAAQIAHGLKMGGLVGLEEAARRSGILGRLLPRYLPGNQ